jgi:hypothetical protein
MNAKFFGMIVLAVLFLGCSKGDFPTAKTEGVVLCEGKPVVGAAV